MPRHEWYYGRGFACALRECSDPFCGIPYKSFNFDTYLRHINNYITIRWIERSVNRILKSKMTKFGKSFFGTVSQIKKLFKKIKNDAPDTGQIYRLARAKCYCTKFYLKLKTIFLVLIRISFLFEFLPGVRKWYFRISSLLTVRYRRTSCDASVYLQR